MNRKILKKGRRFFSGEAMPVEVLELGKSDFALAWLGAVLERLADQALPHIFLCVRQKQQRGLDTVRNGFAQTNYAVSASAPGRSRGALSAAGKTLHVSW